MKKAMLIVTILFIAVVSTACINNFAVQELNNKAKLFMDNGDYEAAINRLEASIDLDNTIFETQYNLGVAYIKAGRYKSAISTLTKAIELKPDNADSYYSLAIAQESFAEKLYNYQDIKKDDEECSEALNRLDEEFTKPVEQRKIIAIGLYDDAIKSYKNYLEKSPNAKDNEEVQNRIKDIEEFVSE